MRPSSSGSDGERTRREVLGDEHVDRAQAAPRSSPRPFQDFITRYAWGDVWNRPGLDRRQRSMITLAALTAVRAEGELELHVRAALRNGLTPEEIARGAAAHRRLRRGPGGQRGVRDRPAGAGGGVSDDRAAHFVQSLERGLAVIRAFGADTPSLTLVGGRARDRPHARRDAALPAHALRPRLRALRRAALRADPARARARLRVPVEPVAARGRRAAPGAARRRGPRVLLGQRARRRRHRLRRARADRRGSCACRSTSAPASRPTRPRWAACCWRAWPRTSSTRSSRGRELRRLSARTITSRGEAARRARPRPPPGLGDGRPGARGGPALGRRADPRPRRPRRRGGQPLRAREPHLDPGDAPRPAAAAAGRRPRGSRPTCASPPRARRGGRRGERARRHRPAAGAGTGRAASARARRSSPRSCCSRSTCAPCSRGCRRWSPTSAPTSASRAPRRAC